MSFLLADNQDLTGILKRSSAHLIVSDYPSAIYEIQSALKKTPQDPTLLKQAIKIFASAGNEKEMCALWNHYASLFPDEAKANVELQEALAWGVIQKAADSPLPMIRLCSLIGSFFANDAKSIPLLKQFCHDKSTVVRGAAVQLISEMRDAPLCDEIFALLKSEKNWKVRLEVIKAVGKMKISASKPTLLSLVAADQTTAEEKAAAIAALILLIEKIDRKELLALVHSNRAGLRLLACEAVCHLRSVRDQDLMLQLTADNHADVRSAALYALGLLGANAHSIACHGTQDKSPETAVTAAWLTTILEPVKAREVFLPLITHPTRNIRLLAAASIAATGQHGTSLALELFHSSQDPFFKMNLALGLIYQQIDVRAACDALYEGLSADLGRWMWNKDHFFPVLSPSNVKQDESIPNAPEAIDQLTRLEILNLLAIMKYPLAEKAIRQFLQQHQWGITGLASALLLMEGDDSSLELVQNLQKDPDPKIQLQAALTVALWGGKEEALSILENHYANSNRETKEKILEALGKIRSRASIPFLIERLQEPQQILRVIAASSLLQCLYH